MPSSPLSLLWSPARRQRWLRRFPPGDDDLADEFARFKQNGGVCLSEVPQVADDALKEARRFRHLAFAGVVGDVVNAEGLVRYDELASDPELLALLDATLAQLAAVDPAKLGPSTGRTPCVLGQRLQRHRLEKCRARLRHDAGFRVDANDFSFFKRREHTVGGVVYSLIEI